MSSLPDPIEAWCPASGRDPWDPDGCHVLVASGPPGRSVLVCRWCRVAAADLLAGLAYPYG